MWWLASKVLATNDPRAEAMRCVTVLQDDPTAAAFAYELPDDCTVTADRLARADRRGAGPPGRHPLA